MDIIGDAQDFSGKAPITLSGDFSVEILTEVTLCYKLKTLGLVKRMNLVLG